MANLPNIYRKPLVLYSVNTLLAYVISEQYYRQKHYVWCSPFFNSRAISSLDINTPPTSNPFDIYVNLRKEVESGDRHSAKVKENKVGILRGAMFKRQAGVISSEEEKDIVAMVDAAETRDFIPIVYVIPFARVSNIVRKVPVNERAHPLSIEYMIENLPRHNFDPVSFDSIRRF
jgi:hypothetical protein